MDKILSEYQLNALTTLNTECEQLSALRHTIASQAFNNACELLYHCKGKVITMGVGKSGHIARKIAASLASTGTSSFFVHPCEAGHGDAGMIGKQDVVIYISNSGEADEFAKLLHYFKAKEIPLIAITNNPNSSLAVNSQIVLELGVSTEACPLKLTPTSSTTNTLVLGDCLVVSLIHKRNLTSNDFALSHPFGALGRKLLVTNAKVMHTLNQLPLATADTLLSDAIAIMSDKGLGCILVTEYAPQDDQACKCIGIFTDGDLRRLLQKRINIYQLSLADCMTTNFTTTTPESLAFNTLELLEQKHISVIPVIDSNNDLTGMVHLHTLLNIGLK